MNEGACWKMRGLAMSACGLLIIAILVHYFFGLLNEAVIKGWLMITIILFVIHLVTKKKKTEQ